MLPYLGKSPTHEELEKLMPWHPAVRHGNIYGNEQTAESRSRDSAVTLFEPGDYCALTIELRYKTKLPANF